jgi:hypothetical protein
MAAADRKETKITKQCNAMQEKNVGVNRNSRKKKELPKVEAGDLDNRE